MLPHPFDTSSVMTKSNALADRAFVVNLPDPFHQRSLEVRFPYCDSFLLSLPGSVPRHGTNLVFPPVIEAVDRKDGQVIPFEWIIENGRILGVERFREALQESKQIYSVL